MAQTSKDDLKKYFETGDKPTQTEYAELIDALRHVDEKLPIADVESLQTSLDSKATTDALLNHINDATLHQSNMSGADIKTAYEAEADTNAFTDAEKQQVADGVVHRADTSSHVSGTDKTKWNNQLSVYSIGEVLSNDMGNIFRINNGSLYQYVGDFPNANTFTTSDFSAELAENPTRWTDILSTYPPPQFVTLTPSSVQPDSTKWIEVNGSNLKHGTTLDFGTDITVLQYTYQSSERILVEVQSNSNVGYSTLPTINNGKVTSVTQSFTISLGDLYVPGSIETPWTSQDSSLIYTLGGVENTLGTFHKAGTFTDGVPVESDCSLTFSLVDVTGSQHINFGFGNSTGSSSISNAYFRSYSAGNLYGQNSNSGTHTMDSDLAGSTIELKRIKQTASTCNIEVYQNGVLQDTFYTVSVTEVWYPYFYMLNPAKIENIELLIL